MPPATMRLESPPCDNNNASGAELALLAKLEEANRLFESDAKSLNSLSGTSASGHSRKGSDTSQISLTSGKTCFESIKNSETVIWFVVQVLVQR